MYPRPVLRCVQDGNGESFMNAWRGYIEAEIEEVSGG